MTSLGQLTATAIRYGQRPELMYLGKDGPVWVNSRDESLSYQGYEGEFSNQNKTLLLTKGY